jgi:4-hydroxy-4-methyl-2-oxoglutarate aldolase
MTVENTTSRSERTASFDLIKRLEAFSAATIHEAQDKTGAMCFAIKPIYPGIRIAGTALTVECQPGDNLSIHAAIAQAVQGDVLVVDFHGELEAGPFGDILGTACIERGIAGVVIDGCARDRAELLDMGFPVFARGLNMKGTNKRNFGAIGKAIQCGGVSVSPGDMILGDDDGVVVVPAETIEDVLAAAETRETAEEEMRHKIREGALTVDLLGLRGFLP